VQSLRKLGGTNGRLSRFDIGLTSDRLKAERRHWRVFSFMEDTKRVRMESLFVSLAVPASLVALSRFSGIRHPLDSGL
jgi:hypothetical protein